MSVNDSHALEEEGSQFKAHSLTVINIMRHVSMTWRNHWYVRHESHLNQIFNYTLSFRTCIIGWCQWKYCPLLVVYSHNFSGIIVFQNLCFHKSSSIIGLNDVGFFTTSYLIVNNYWMFISCIGIGVKHPYVYHRTP